MQLVQTTQCLVKIEHRKGEVTQYNDCSCILSRTKASRVIVFHCVDSGVTVHFVRHDAHLLQVMLLLRDLCLVTDCLFMERLCSFTD
jgi:hypothetical protein